MKNLKEMPYVTVDNKKSFFDLEIENFTSSSDIIDYFRDIIYNEKEKADKYGNKIKLISKKAKINFVNDIKNNSIIYNSILSKLSNTGKDEFKEILSSVDDL